MNRIGILKNNSGKAVRVFFMCPGCNEKHFITTSEINDGETPWNFNKNFEFPTFTPSILVTCGNSKVNKVCHSFVTDGKIQFLGDCTHDLKNQTVYLPEINS